MKLGHSLRSSLPILLAFLIVFETAAFVATHPRPQASFVEIYALGANNSPSNYYPNNSSFIQIGETVKWFIGVSNQMGSVQFVDIRVKLGNLTISPPNDTTASPSPAPTIVDFKKFLANNATWEIPFEWQLQNATATPNGHARILQLGIGNNTYTIQNSPSCANPKECAYRFIFEVWTWDVLSADFQIGWPNSNERQIAWVQMWFDLTPGAY